tara:strand:- start:2404 stop:2829 length:426 start_codon:yes stop_codon:yes gene_type:complete
MLTKLILILFPFLIFSQTNDISGVWLEEKKQSHIEIYKNKNGLYEGKVIWLAEPLDENGNIKKDKENPNPKLREKKLEGLIIIKELEATDDNKWGNGSIYDARSGKTYSLNATLKNNNTLFMRGYIGFSLIGKTTTWTKIN